MGIPVKRDSNGTASEGSIDKHVAEAEFPAMPTRHAIKHALKKFAWRLSTEEMRRRRMIAAYPKILETGIAFIHIPKAAGTSISALIYGEQIGHLRWHDVYWSNPFKYDDLMIFAIVRDPLDRFLSAYRFLSKGGINKSDRTFSDTILSGFLTANDLAEGLSEPNVRCRIMRKVHFKPQSDFVCRPDGAIMVDHLVRFETIGSDLTKIMKNVTIEQIPHKNATQAENVEDDRYLLNAASEDILREVYATDFALMSRAGELETIRNQKISFQGIHT